MSSNSLVIQGRILRETEKALLIAFKNGRESWVPKSTVFSSYNSNSEETQEFTIAKWLLEKNNILLNSKNINRIGESGFQIPPKSEEFDFSFSPDDSELKIIDIEPNMKSITIYGRIKEIYSKFRFDRNDGSKGQGASFLLHNPSGDIRVVLWDQHAKAFSSNEFNVNELVKINNAYAKKGRAGTEIHVSRYGNIILAPQGVDLTKHPKLKRDKRNITKEDITQRIQSIGISEVKVKRIICPYCGSMCSEKLKSCGKCGEPLPKS